MKLSRTIAYAIHAMLLLAGGQRGVPIPCSQLASDGQMPERFLLQILRTLVTSGLLRSSRGVDGGYFLARPADEITLRDIVDSFDNSLSPSVLTLEGMPINVEKRVTAVLEKASAAAREALTTMSMADLVRPDRHEHR